MDQDEVEIHKNAKKRTWPISSHLDFTLGQQCIYISGFQTSATLMIYATPKKELKKTTRSGDFFFLFFFGGGGGRGVTKFQVLTIPVKHYLQCLQSLLKQAIFFFFKGNWRLR